MRALTHVCATRAVAACVAGSVASPLFVQQYQRRGVSMLASPTAVQNGWFCDWFNKTRLHSAARTVDATMGTAPAHNAQATEQASPNTAEATQVSPMSEPMMKPYVAPVRRLRLDIVARRMRAALRRLQEAHSKDVEHKIHDTRSILASIRSKIEALKRKLHDAEMRVMRRIN